MRAEQLRKIAAQAEVLKEARRGLVQPDDFTKWAKRVRGFERIVRRIEADIDFSLLLTPDEQGRLMAALSNVESGVAATEGHQREPSSAIAGMDAIGKISCAIADRVKYDAAAKLVGEFLREAAVLVAVFGFLDKLLRRDPITPEWAGGIFCAGVVLLWIGSKIESWSSKDG